MYINGQWEQKSAVIELERKCTGKWRSVQRDTSRSCSALQTIDLAKRATYDESVGPLSRYFQRQPSLQGPHPWSQVFLSSSRSEHKRHQNAIMLIVKDHESI